MDKHSGEGENGLPDFAAQAAKIGLRGHPHGIVMEAADRNLAVIKLQERPTLPKILELVQQVACKLRHFHERGLIHGDLKPLNIVRTMAGEFMIIDYDGSARIGIDRAGRKYSSAHIPPEGMLGVEGLQQLPVAHPSWDMFSLGVLVFELVTSTPLFPRNARNDNIEKLEPRRQLCLWHGPSPSMLQEVGFCHYLSRHSSYMSAYRHALAAATPRADAHSLLAVAFCVQIRDAKVEDATPALLDAVCHVVEWCLQVRCT